MTRPTRISVAIPADRQRGAALLLLMLVVLVSITAVLVAGISNSEARIRQSIATRDSLAQARRALIDYAVVQQDLQAGSPAQLPCPDIDDTGVTIEGEAHTDVCGAAGVSVIGRLPWRTLGVDTLRDASSECLWYAVSGSWKQAAGSTAELINPDSNGQLQLWSLETGNVIEGATSDSRPVAIVFAANAALAGQSRAAASAGEFCDPGFSANDFLDADSSLGISNAVLGGSADAVDAFAVAERYSATHNDRAAVITRADLERAITARHDFDNRMRALGLAVTRCVADYAQKNPGGAGDRRLPWPAPLSMADYRPDASYDDADFGSLSGRLANAVDTSNVLTGNPTTEVLTSCDSGAVPEWDAEMQRLWKNWKDHFFYVVAESHSPAAGTPSTCATCLTVNGSGQYAAVVLFGNSRLTAAAQSRNAPPMDSDDRLDPQNYLEGGNAAYFPLLSGTADFSSQATSNTFNDRLYCIDSSLAVTEC